MRTIGALAATAVIAVLSAVAAYPYVSVGDSWPDGIVTMQLQLGPSGQLLDGSASFGESAERALSEWNLNLQRLQFRVVRDSQATRGDGNGINNVFFSNDIYGMAFDASTLAVTTHWSRRSTRIEADVIFNQSAGPWDSYSGPLRRGIQDFHRVALHEFGHVVGLDHPDENGQAVTAVMNSRISSLDRLSADDVAGALALYSTNAAAPGGAADDSTRASFPPRNESLDFRTQLETKYRNGLRRASTATFVDAEGDVVWTEEYLRYRVYQCSHQQAVDRVMSEIDGAGTPTVCGPLTGRSIAFPPRDQSVDFRNQLEAKYRDSLRRSSTTSTVDREGDVVWTQEYLRYRINGCSHGVAVQNVLTQIDGFPAPALCR